MDALHYIMKYIYKYYAKELQAGHIPVTWKQCFLDSWQNTFQPTFLPTREEKGCPFAAPTLPIHHMTISRHVFNFCAPRSMITPRYTAWI